MAQADVDAPQQRGSRIVWDSRSLRSIDTLRGRFYRYAPSFLIEGGGKSEHCWACRNREEGVIKDSIFHTTFEGGRPVQDQAVLLAGQAPAWDSFHVCDPSLIAGRFRLGDRTYRYALFYLGNDINASRHNQIGVAFAADISGPWVRLPSPLISHSDARAWGVGQPSAVSLDRRGRLYLFYTCGDRDGTRILCREVDLSDARAPHVGAAVPLSRSGLTGTDGKPDWWNNADFARDPLRERFIAVREQHPYPHEYPQYIGASLQIVSIATRDLSSPDALWRVEGEIGPDLTGFARNHNAGLVRDSFGALPDPKRLRVVFASSAAGKEAGTAEWTYRLWELQGNLG